MIRRYCFVILLLLNIGLMPVRGQQCFDMEALTDNVRFVNADVKLLKITIDELTREKSHLYGWDYTDSPAGHPRQTLMEADGYDDLCPQLRVLPPLGNTSVRLANDGYQPGDSAKAEAVKFTFTVLPNRPLCIVQYAAVLETAAHPLSTGYFTYGNPWCQISVLARGDIQKQYTIRHNSYIGESIQGFQSFTDALGHPAVWKDWSADTLDFSEFIGEELTVTLECADCAIVRKYMNFNGKEEFQFCEDHHLGRMYAHLRCSNYPYICEGTFECPDTVCAYVPSFSLSNRFTEGSVLSYDLLFDEKALAQGFVNQTDAVLDSGDGPITVDMPLFGDTDVYPRTDTYTASLVLHTICEKDTVIPIRFTLLFIEGTIDYPATLCADMSSFTISNHFLPGSVVSYDLLFDDYALSQGFRNHTDVCMKCADNSVKVDIPAFDHTEDRPAIDTYTASLVLHTVCDRDTVLPVRFSLLFSGGTFDWQDTLCADVPSLTLNNRFTKGAVVSYDLLFDDYALSQGFQNRQNAVLDSDDGNITVDMPGGDDAGSYPRPDTYTASLVLHTICGRDEVIPVEFTLLYPAGAVLFQRWNDVLSVYNAVNNGGYAFSRIEWYKDGQSVSGYGEDNAYYKEPGGFNYAGPSSYSVALTRTDDGKTLCSCAYQPEPQDEGVELKGIDVVQDIQGRIRIKARTEGSYSLYSIGGSLIRQGIFESDKPFCVDVPYSGLFILHYRLSDGETGHLSFQTAVR